MFRQQREHVVEERNAGRNLRLAPPINRECQRNLRLRRITLNCCDAFSHERSPSRPVGLECLTRAFGNIVWTLAGTNPRTNRSMASRRRWYTTPKAIIKTPRKVRANGNISESLKTSYDRYPR